MMRAQRRILLFSMAFLLVWNAPVALRADGTSTHEYQLKAAFLYNFIMFVDSERFHELDESRAQDGADPNDPILIGILGKDPFADAFDPLKDEDVRDRRVAIQRFKGFEQLADAEGWVPNEYPQLDRLKRCHVLFISSSEKRYMARILKPISKQSILTVADTPGFLEAGGIINFVIEDKKVHFEINTAAARRARLQLRSKLLRLAKRLVKTDALEGQNDEEDETDN